MRRAKILPLMIKEEEIRLMGKNKKKKYKLANSEAASSVAPVVATTTLLKQTATSILKEKLEVLAKLKKQVQQAEEDVQKAENDVQLETEAQAAKAEKAARENAEAEAFARTEAEAMRAQEYIDAHSRETKRREEEQQKHELAQKNDLEAKHANEHAEAASLLASQAAAPLEAASNTLANSNEYKKVNTMLDNMYALKTASTWQLNAQLRANYLCQEIKKLTLEDLNFLQRHLSEVDCRKVEDKRLNAILHIENTWEAIKAAVVQEISEHIVGRGFILEFHQQGTHDCPKERINQRLAYLSKKGKKDLAQLNAAQLSHLADYVEDIANGKKTNISLNGMRKLKPEAFTTLQQTILEAKAKKTQKGWFSSFFSKTSAPAAGSKATIPTPTSNVTENPAPAASSADSGNIPPSSLAGTSPQPTAPMQSLFAFAKPDVKPASGHSAPTPAHTSPRQGANLD